jgi:hypothetical protein
MQSNVVYTLTNVQDFKDIVSQHVVKTEINANINSGKYKNINVSSSDDNYKVVRYDKDFLAIDLIPTYGLFRSIILNKENKVVSFAPPKSLHSDTFIKKYLDKTNDIIAEEFVEGTMINIFWDPCIGIGGSWEIATRNKVGAKSYFYKNKQGKTFREMFTDCCKANGLDYDQLNKSLCYSFVMQHPDNRIVVPFSKPQLYLVQVCEIVNTEDGTANVIIHDMKNVKEQGMWASTNIKFPQVYENWSKYSDLIENYASMNTPYNVVGVIIRKCTTNERCKIRNPVYEEVRQLRGNQPKLQYQYLCLRKEGKVGDFLKFYPEYKKEFSSFRDQVHLFTNTLFKNYISCYIKKENPLLEFPGQYRTHMFTIHQKYMNELKEKNLYVTNSVVIEYVNTMHPSKLMYCLNFSMRKRVVDFIKADVECDLECDLE